MKLSECKSLIRGYRKCAEEGNVDFNWLTTARWSLRHSWAAEERDAAIARAERAEAEVERLKSELNALSNYIMDDEIISVLALAPSDLGPITQESLLPDVMPPLGRRTIEIMERKIAPSNNESEG